MNKFTPKYNVIIICAIILSFGLTMNAAQILKETGITGGIIVQIGCPDGTFTASLRKNDAYLVQGLDPDQKNVDAAHKQIKKLGLYGPVSVDLLRGRELPYRDNMINLIISENPGSISMKEIMRVLVPNGVAYIKNGNFWKKTIKPRPKEMDDWTHVRYDAGNNVVSKDRLVSPPKYYQWVGSPAWARHHDHMSSLTSMVSAGGRIFYIFDEGDTSSILLPPKWNLIARDAFNGTILWKRTISNWETHLWAFKSGPFQLQARLVASAERIFTTLEFVDPVTALDSSTGKTIRTYKNTKGTEEILFYDNTLYLVVNPSLAMHRPDNMEDILKYSKALYWEDKKRTVMAINADTGKTLWKKKTIIMPATLCVDDAQVYFNDGENVVALKRKTGAQSWKTGPIKNNMELLGSSTPTMLVQNGVVFFYGSGRGLLFHAVSAKTGEKLWSKTVTSKNWRRLKDLFVIKDTAYWANIQDDYIETIGLDIFTGKETVKYTNELSIFWFHHRCYRPKATERFLLYSKTGIEFVDIHNKKFTPNHWIRGACTYGIMPANGLIYTPPHPCACYVESKVNGLSAVSGEQSEIKILTDAQRFIKGPAYMKAPKKDTLPGDWPTYRSDNERSGFTHTAGPVIPSQSWETTLSGRLSAPVVARNKVFTASIDTHTLYALDADTGKQLWEFTAGARIDSPPTWYKGMLFFGSADGWVYALRASDGILSWQYSAAPNPRKMSAWEQIESIWPVHGSILIQNDKLYCVAGRNMFLDNGIRMSLLDPISGKKIKEIPFDEFHPDTGKSVKYDLNKMHMATTIPDILSSDGKNIYMRSLSFSLDGKRRYVKPREQTEEPADDRHLFCGGGMLDDSWFHRHYWQYGDAPYAGAGYANAGQYAPSGRLLVCDEKTVYGFGRQAKYYRWTTPMEYRLFAADKKAEVNRLDPVKGISSNPKFGNKRIKGFSTFWEINVPIHVRAMVHAKDTLYIAGRPDLLNEDEAIQDYQSKKTKEQINQQSASIRGEKGAVLMQISSKDGRKKSEYKLKNPPVFDGMAIANGRIYYCTTDGKVICLKNK